MTFHAVWHYTFFPILYSKSFSTYCLCIVKSLNSPTYRIMKVPPEKVVLPTINFIVIHLADILQEQQEKEDMIRRPVPNSPISWVDDRK